jgi:hypothetical protein
MRAIVGWLNPLTRSKSRLTRRRSPVNSVRLGRLRGECLEARLALDGAGASLVSFPTELYIPQDLVVKVNNTISVPVLMHVNQDLQLTGVDIAFSYDSSQFTVSNVRAGAALTGFGATSGSSTPGTVRFTASRATAVTYPFDTINSLILFDITPIAGPATVSNLNLRISDGAFTTALFDQNGAQLPLDPVPTNASTDSVDGKITVSTISRNANLPEDVDDDTHVSSRAWIWFGWFRRSTARRQIHQGRQANGCSWM